MDKIFDLIKQEQKRQEETLMMIPSENYAWPEVAAAVGSVLMNKYAEGYPKKRYYQGNGVVDEIELLCQRRALEAFGLDGDNYGVNVQPHSGCEANLAVYNALLAPGDKILAMNLLHGGHLSHGWRWQDQKTTFVSKIWRTEFYGVDKGTMVFDYDQIEKLAEQFKPKLIISGGTAYPREINYQRMGEIARSTDAYYLADIAHEAGLVAAGVNDSPFRYADVVTMTTHKTLRGPRGALIFARQGLTEAINKSVFPGLQGGPHMHTIAGIAVALGKTKTKEFKDCARNTVKNAKSLANGLIENGLDLISGGTDKHLLLIDLRNKNTNGWFAAWALEAAGIIVNRNTIPYDASPPYYPLGIRLGTPALTVRGMGGDEMKQIAEWISTVIKALKSENIPEDRDERSSVLKKFKSETPAIKEVMEVRNKVKILCSQFPILKDETNNF